RLRTRIASIGHRRELPILQDKLIAPPGDGVAGVAANPDQQANEVAQRHQPQITKYLAIAQYPPAHRERHRETRDQHYRQQDPRPRRTSTYQHRQQGPGDGKSEHQAGVTPSPRIAGAAAPAKLMLEEVRK